MSLARAWTRIARSGYEHPNHGATAPPPNGTSKRKLSLLSGSSVKLQAQHRGGLSNVPRIFIVIFAVPHKYKHKFSRTFSLFSKVSYYNITTWGFKNFAYKFNCWVVFIESLLHLFTKRITQGLHILFSAWNLALESTDSTLNMQDFFLLCYKVYSFELINFRKCFLFP